MIRTFIYGSCVSRDTFEHLPTSKFRLLTYVARQSLASAFADSPSVSPSAEMPSAFRARMLRNDWISSLPKQLSAASRNTDLVLWDLCDERLGFFDLGEGQIVTKSVELLSTDFASLLPTDASHVDLGSQDHIRAFETSLDRFRRLLESLHLRGKVLLLAPPWAELDEMGQGRLGSFGRTAQEANAIFETYTELAASKLGCPIVGAGIQTTASSAHKWGRAPFHYSGEVYEALTHDIMSRLPHMGHSE